MFLYHYSARKHDVLKSLSASDTLSTQQIAESYERAERFSYKTPDGLVIKLPYVNHISFFFDPIPAQLLPTLFKNHPVWFEGNELYEHIIDVNKLPPKILYQVVESPDKTKFMDEFVKQHKWVDDNPELLKQFMNELMARQWKKGELGYKRADLIKQIQKHDGQIADYFKAAVKRSDFEENKTKYAANVAHVMLYPITGKLTHVERVNKVVIGKNERSTVSIRGRF